MKKLTAGIFSVLLGLVSVGGANAAVVSTEYLSEVLQTELADVQTKANILKSTEVNGTTRESEDRYVSAAAADKIAQDAVGALTNGIANMDADKSTETGFVMTGVVQEDGLITEIKEAQITNAYIADDAAIAKAKLAEDVRSSLGLADTALQKADIVTGTANGTINVEGSDVAVAGLGTAAYKADTDFDAAGTASRLVSDAKSELQTNINLKANIADVTGVTYSGTNYLNEQTGLKAATIKLDAQVKANADTIAILEGGETAEGSIKNLTAQINDNKAAIALLNDTAATAGSVDNSIQEALSGLANDTAKTGQFVTAVSRENGVITVSRAALVASDIPTLSIEKVNGLQDALDAKQVSLTGQEGVIVIANGVVSIAAKGIGTEQLADKAVTSDKIADNAVTAGKIAPDAVTEGTIADAAVVAGNLAANAVVEGNIAAGAVTAGTIAAGAVKNDNISDGELSVAKVEGLQASLNAKFEVPAYTTTTQNGTYVLTATELDGKVTYAWENIAGRDE